METASNLQARVQAATQSLAGREADHRKLEQNLQRLEGENAHLGAENERFGNEIDVIREEGDRLTAEAEQLRGENKRLIADNSRFRDEIERYEVDNDTLRVDSERLNRLLESLVSAVEGEAGGEVENEFDLQTAEVVEMPLVVADGTTGMPINCGVVDPGTTAVVSAMRDKYFADENDAVPNENARRLMDRIKERIEAERV